MKKLKIFYWIFTVLMVVGLGLGSLFNAMSSPESVDLITGKLGYPEYVVPFVGVVKILGLIAILIPGFPRIKEWAYAGLIFDIVAAFYSHVAIGAPATDLIGFPVFVGVIFGSYYFYHRIRKASGEAAL